MTDMNREEIDKETKGVDPIERYLDNETKDDVGNEVDPNAEAEERTEDKSQGDKQSQGDKTDSNSGDKNRDDKQAPVDKGKKDESKAGTTNAGDLKLDDGTVVKAGAERRFYEKSQLAERQLSMRTNELRQANQSRDNARQELQQLKSTVQSLQGADPQHVSTGLKLVRDLQRDPATTLRNLLTEAVAAGYTIEGIAAGVDAQSIRQAVEDQYKPIAEQYNTQQSQQQLEQNIEKEVTDFYSANPDARLHDEVIAGVMAKNPQMGLSEAYYQLRNAVIDRGLDWSKPLPPQMQGGEQQQQQNNQQSKKPMPNGRGPSDDSQVKSADRNVVAHETTDMSSIIKDAMRENGLKIN